LPVISNAAKDIFEAPENISVSDFAKVLSTNTKAYMMSANEALLSTKGAKIVFVTVDTTSSERVDLYADRIYKSWGIKNINNGNSVMVLFSIDDMQYWICVPETLKSVLTSDVTNKLLMDYAESDFASGNFDSSARKLYDALNSWYNSTYKSDIANEDKDTSDTKSSVNVFGIILTVLKWLGIILLIVFTAFILFIFIRREIRLRKLKNQRRQRRLMRKEQLRREMEKNK
jgi:uncharacterized membrane protein YgcG